MTKKVKILSLIAIGSSMVLGTVALSLSGAFSSIGSNFARATGNEYSVSFARADAYSASGTTYSYKKQTPNGNDIYLFSQNGKSRNSGALGTVPSTYDSTLDALTLMFYVDDSMTHGFRHQAISSITVTTGASFELDLQTSPDGVTFRSKASLSCSTSGATYSNFNEYDRFIKITETSNSRGAAARNVTGVSLTYECVNQTESFSSAVYSATVKDKSNLDSAMSIHLNSDGYGYYSFYYNTDAATQYTLFTWVYDESCALITVNYTSTAAGSIAGMEAIGTSTTYQGYRLFARFNASYYNYIGIFGDKATVFFHSSQATSGEANKNQYQRSEFTVLTLD